MRRQRSAESCAPRVWRNSQKVLPWRSKPVQFWILDLLEIILGFVLMEGGRNDSGGTVGR